jgi:ABC-type enterochelin transport system permease subunit
VSTAVVGVLRLVAALAVVLLGALAVLVVLDILPRELLQTWGIKVLLVTGIIGVVALVVTLLSRKGPE